uniref:EH domain-containing protein n=1 Tax=Salmo trutta TaxID=8032 RepID=A0A673W6P9_SALTR
MSKVAIYRRKPNSLHDLHVNPPLQVDLGNTGKVGAADAAQFLNKSGLSDSTLGKIWDLANPERKGFLDKRGFFVALRLVASAQGGNDISLNNLIQTLAAPKVVNAPPKMITITNNIFYFS